MSRIVNEFDKWWRFNGIDLSLEAFGHLNADVITDLSLSSWANGWNRALELQFEDEPCDNRQEKWDRRFILLAKHVASWSRDPSTRTGAVITDQDGRIVSVGYNGFAKGVNDFPERYADRDYKYKTIVHCERNAIIFAKRDLTDCVLYTYPFMSCSTCSSMVIQAGIKRCVAPVMPPDKAERWRDDMAIATQQFKEAGVELVEMPWDWS